MDLQIYRSLPTGPREQFLESLPKLRVEDGVDDRVQETVDVAQPDEEGEVDRADVTGRALVQVVPDTDGTDDVEGEERDPAHQEDT